MSLVHTLGHELKQVGLVTLYFLGWFGLVLVLKRLFLAEYRIEVYALSAAVIGALVAGKIVVILDKTRLGTRFDERHAVGLAALYKTLCYASATFVILIAERLIHAFRDVGSLDRAVAHVWESRNWNVIVAKALIVGVAYAGYHLYAGIDRRLGKGVLGQMIWQGAGRIARSGRARDA